MEFVGDDPNYQTKFSAETQNKMDEFARSMFKDPQHGFAKQVLNIALCEC
jgi:hypothetical protein